jgi:hypothetical protein
VIAEVGTRPSGGERRRALAPQLVGLLGLLRDGSHSPVRTSHRGSSRRGRAGLLHGNTELAWLGAESLRGRDHSSRAREAALTARQACPSDAARECGHARSGGVEGSGMGG